MIIKIKAEFPIGDLLYANKSIQDDSGNWNGIITNIGILNRSISYKNAYEESGFSVTFSDKNRYFRDMMSSSTNKLISGKKVTGYTEDNTQEYTGTVSSWSYPKDGFTINITDKLSGINDKINNTITIAEFSGTVNDSIGNFIPVIYGVKEDTLGTLKCWQTSTGSYLVARHHCKSIDNIFEDGAEISSGWSIDNNADGYCYVTYAGGTEDYIVINVSGSMDISDNLITEPIEALRDLIDNYCSMDYGVASFLTSEAVMQQRNYVINSIITSETLAGYMKNFCYSFASTWFVKKNNRIKIDTDGTFTSSIIGQLKNSSNSSDVLKGTLRTNEDLSNMVNVLQVFNKFNHYKNEYKNKPVKTDTNSVANYGSFFEEYYIKCTSDTDTIDHVTTNYISQKKNPIIKTYFSTRIKPLLDLSAGILGNIITFADYSGVTTSAQKYKVMRMGISFSGEFVQLELLKLYPEGGCFILGDETTLSADWDTATSLEREYGYLGDETTGFFSNGYDPDKVLCSE